MSDSFRESGFTTNDGGWPTNPTYAYKADAYFCITTIDNDAIIFGGADLSLIPTNASIVGIRVRLLADWHDPGATALVGRLQAAITWNNGSNWTATKSSGVLIKDSITGDFTKSYYLGGPTDTWGRTWTVAEVQASDFKVRVTSDSDSLTGAPEWRLDFIQIAVYYNVALVSTAYETMQFVDTVATDRLSFDVGEYLSVVESEISVLGTAVTDHQSSAVADFDAAAKYQRIEAAIVQFEFGASGPLLYIGDSAVVTAPADTSWIVKLAQPGLIAIDSITYTSDFGKAQEPSQAMIRVANREYGDVISSTVASIPEHMQGKSVLGGKVRVYALVKGDTAWYRRVIFYGRMSSMDITETEITFNAVQIGSGGIPVPDLVINDNTFFYEENQYGGVDGREGQKIADNMGAVIPIGIGRFDVKAVDSSWPSGHLFNETSGMEKAGTGVVAAMAGIKYPMMPCVAAVNNWTGRHSEMSIVGDIVYGRRSQVYQQVYLHGSRKGQRQIFIGHGPPDDVMTYAFGQAPLLGTGNPDQSTLMLPIYTWAKQEKVYDQGLPFVRDNSVRSTNALELIKTEDNLWLWQSAGGMDASTGSREWTDGEAKNAFGVFVNMGIPVDGEVDLLQTKPSYAGALQTVAIPFDSITKPGAWVRQDYYGHGTEGVEVWDSKVILDPKKLKSSLRIHYENSPADEGIASYRIPVAMPSLGDIWGIGIGCVWNPTDSVNGKLAMRGRLAGPEWRNPEPLNDGIHDRGWTMIFGIGAERFFHAEDYARRTNTSLYISSASAYGGGHYIYLTTPSYRYSSYWIFPPWVYNNDSGWLGNGWVQNNTDPNISGRGCSAAWEFMMWGWQDAGAAESRWGIRLKYPWDVAFVCKAVAPANDADVYINGAWLEVVFRSRIFSGTENINDRALIQEMKRTGVDPRRFGYLWWQRQRQPNETNATPASTDIFVSGIGPTKSGGTVIENPADVVECLIDHYSAGTKSTGALQFGSMLNASAIISNYKMSLIVNSQKTMAEVMGQIAMQSRSIIDQQITDDGELTYRMFVDTYDPGSDDPVRFYRPDLDSPCYKFVPGDIFGEEFLALTSDLSELSSNVRVKYGWHLPSQTWLGEKFLDKLTNNLTTDAALYQAAAATAYTSYVDLENPQVYELPDIWDPAVAEDLLKWYFNRNRRRHVTVDFTTYVRHSDIRVGHIIEFDSTISTLSKFPGEVGSSSWAGHYFNVLGVSYTKDVDGFWRVKIMAREVSSTP